MVNIAEKQTKCFKGMRAGLIQTRELDVIGKVQVRTMRSGNAVCFVEFMYFKTVEGVCKDREPYAINRAIKNALSSWAKSSTRHDSAHPDVNRVYAFAAALDLAAKNYPEKSLDQWAATIGCRILWAI